MGGATSKKINCEQPAAAAQRSAFYLSSAGEFIIFFLHSRFKALRGARLPISIFSPGLIECMCITRLFTYYVCLFLSLALCTSLAHMLTLSASNRRCGKKRADCNFLAARSLRRVRSAKMLPGQQQRASQPALLSHTHTKEPMAPSIHPSHHSQ